MDQVGLAQAHAAIEIERVVRLARVVGHLDRGGARQLVGLAGDEVVERQDRVQARALVHRVAGLGAAHRLRLARVGLVLRVLLMLLMLRVLLAMLRMLGLHAVRTRAGFGRVHLGHVDVSHVRAVAAGIALQRMAGVRRLRPRRVAALRVQGGHAGIAARCAGVLIVGIACRLRRMGSAVLRTRIAGAGRAHRRTHCSVRAGVVAHLGRGLLGIGGRAPRGSGVKDEVNANLRFPVLAGEGRDAARELALDPVELEAVGRGNPQRMRLLVEGDGRQRLDPGLELLRRQFALELRGCRLPEILHVFLLSDRASPQRVTSIGVPANPSGFPPRGPSGASTTRQCHPIGVRQASPDQAVYQGRKSGLCVRHAARVVFGPGLYPPPQVIHKG
ncbi:hypothetical protein D3C87_1337280 [compost metagenome]